MFVRLYDVNDTYTTDDCNGDVIYTYNDTPLHFNYLILCDY